tara:strand:+ start:566 stop:937 length:372 start_codon:yes stop_codon:yes gene_type:complete
MTINNNRFSVYLLEKDVLEYVNYKNKYNEFDEKYGTCEYHEKDFYKQKKNFWYKKYIGKMKYLEENYRKTNIYTRYHAQLENVQQTHVELPEPPMAIAHPVPNTEERITPSAPDYDSWRPVPN